MDHQTDPNARLMRLNHRLALAYPLTAFGVLGLVALFNFRMEIELRLAVLLWTVSGMSLVGGVFSLFGRPLLGALIGFAIQVGIVLFLFTQHIV